MFTIQKSGIFVHKLKMRDFVKKNNKFEKIYMKHIEVKPTSSKNVYEKKLVIKKQSMCERYFN